MKILKNVLLVLIAGIASYGFSYTFGSLYGSFFVIGGWVDMTSLIGWPLAYIFFLTFLFTAFGGEGKTKYWWIGILLIPALALEVYLDPAHIYFPILLGILGWGIGWGIRGLVRRSKVASTPLT